MAEAQVQTPLSALRIDRLVTPLKQHRGPRWLIPAVLLVTALVLFGSSLSRRAPTVVRVAEVRAPQLEAPRAELSAAGYVDSRRRAVIAPRLPGRLVDVTVKVGEFVKQGQVVARLDDGDARVVLSRAEAEVRAAEARLAAARARITHAQRTPKGTWSLAKLGVIPHARFLNVEPSGSALQEELDAAKAHFAAALRAREGARLQLSHTVVRAPREGTVARMLAGEGAVLASVTREGASLGGILELVDLDTLEVEAEVSEEQRSQLRAGQPALIFLEAVPHRAFPGRVGTVPSARERSRRATVRVRFQSTPQGALPDMGARVSFLREPLSPDVLDPKARPLRVPATAVVEGEGGPCVWVVRDGRVEPHPVRLGPRVGDELTLEAGPPAGTQVVVSPDTRRLRPGRRVKVEAVGG